MLLWVVATDPIKKGNPETQKPEARSAVSGLWLFIFAERRQTMKERSAFVRDEQRLQLNLMLQETGLSRDLIVNSAINEYFHNYLVWKRRFSFEPKEGDREKPTTDLASALEEWR